MKRSAFALIVILGLLLGACAGAPPLLVNPRQTAGPAALPATAPPSATVPAAPAAGATAAAPPATASALPAATPALTTTVTPSTGAAGRQWQANDVLPLDPTIRTGRLANGLTYMIRHNGEPKSRAELRLVVNAGSVLEDEDQRGLAHFLEHMLFRGTQHFPKQDLLNFLQSIGMRFGPDINAYTSFDETVYELRVPLDDPKVLDTALNVLVDWAAYANIDPADVDAERGVIVEEHRLRELNASGRLRDQIIPLLLGGSRYEQRLPIGDMNIVQNAPAETLRRFYKTWYRPDLQSVIAVGDFDVQTVETQVREKFGALVEPANPQPRPTYTVPDFAGTHYLVATDPENPNTAVEILFKQPVRESHTAGEYRGDLVRTLFFQMLNDRYLQISRQAGAPFTAAAAGQDTLVRTAADNVISAQTQEQNVLPALDRLLTEVERVRQYGFTQSELDRARSDLLEFYRRAAAQRETTDSSQLTDEYIRHILQGESVPGIAVEDELARQFIPGITLEDVNREIEGLVGKDNRVLLAVAPQKPGYTPPTQDDLAGLAQTVAGRQIQPYAEQIVSTPLMTTTLTPARVISETVLPDLGVTDLRLANGVRVLLKPTDFNQEQVLFSGIGPGGASLVDDKDYTAAVLGSTIVGESGVAGYTRTELDRLLSGKSVSVNLDISELSQGMSGGASPRYLETAFQLIYLYATEPRLDPDAVASIKAAALAALANRNLSPDAALRDALTTLAYGDSIRRKPIPPLDAIENLDASRAFEIYKARFANMTGFTFVFVGNFDVAQVKALAQTYLGNLPGTGRPDTWQSRLPGYREGVQQQDLYRGQDQRAVAQIVYHGAQSLAPEDQLRFAVLRQVLDIMLVRELRINLAGTYSPSAHESVEQQPQAQYALAINFTADPARMKDLVNVAIAQVDALRQQGPTGDDLSKAKEQEKLVYEDNLRKNDFWLGTLQSWAFDPQHEDPRLPLQAQDVIDKITTQDIQTFVAQYLRQDSYIKIVLYPESARPGQLQVLAPAGNDATWPVSLPKLSPAAVARP